MNLADFFKEESLVDLLALPVSHFPEYHYEWPDSELIGAHCAQCGSDYVLRRIEGVTLNDIPLYVSEDCIWMKN